MEYSFKWFILATIVQLPPKSHLHAKGDSFGAITVRLDEAEVEVDSEAGSSPANRTSYGVRGAAGVG